MDVKLLHERYDSLEWPQQLGNLASTLARVSARATAAQHDALVIDLLREAALLIEWGAPQVPSVYWPELAAMQREVLAWQRVWPLEAARSLLVLHARNQSDRLLQMAGLIGGLRDVRP